MEKQRTSGEARIYEAMIMGEARVTKNPNENERKKKGRLEKEFGGPSAIA